MLDVSYEYLQHVIAQTGIVVFEIAGLLGIIIYLSKRLLREARGLIVLWGKCRRSMHTLKEDSSGAR